MKELDVLLEAFLDQQSGALRDGDWQELEWFLEQEDDVLFDWISGRNLPADSALLRLIKTLTHVI